MSELEERLRALAEVRITLDDLGGNETDRIVPQSYLDAMRNGLRQAAEALEEWGRRAQSREWLGEQEAALDRAEGCVTQHGSVEELSTDLDRPLLLVQRHRLAWALRGKQRADQLTPDERLAALDEADRLLATEVVREPPTREQLTAELEAHVDPDLLGHPADAAEILANAVLALFGPEGGSDG